ncbi:DUF6471 domain-containing protein [Cupriavidus sp. D39]|uniref:DUF6471 domain-containing protein n=1 Tax=Cupriavidus sp. D39 TaxID=2997877 RepID=UPI0022703152|nr:DUF6471 domain-containing protein [Cupriavidus sp. D39]MCY0856661.1 DUF6471 domain-containing protein [Cupriavidus sp. D39]
MILALGAEYPEQWRPVLSAGIGDEESARYILLRELTARDLDSAAFARKLESVGVSIASGALDEQIRAGSFQFVLILQLAAIDHVVGLERFVDDSDVFNARLNALGASG